MTPVSTPQKPSVPQNQPSEPSTSSREKGPRRTSRNRPTRSQSEQKQIEKYKWEKAIKNADYRKIDADAAKQRMTDVLQKRAQDGKARMDSVCRIYRTRRYNSATFAGSPGLPLRKQDRQIATWGNEPKKPHKETGEMKLYKPGKKREYPQGKRDPMPLLVNEREPWKSLAISEYASGSWNQAAGTSLLAANDPHVTPHPYSNKWATPTELKSFLEQEWGGIRFESGYHVYPDDFPTEQNILGALNILSVSNHLWLNPPFHEITRHLVHWLDVAIKTNTAFAIISPVRNHSAKFRFIANLDITTVVYFRNPVHFHSLSSNRTPGPCPSQICIIFLNMRGTSITVNNTRFGTFPIDPTWKAQLRALPNSFNSDLTWAGVKDVVQKYKLEEQQALDLCQPQMSFLDLLPEVGSTLDTKPFTPFSPLWSSKLSPLMRIHFPQDYIPVKRDSITPSRAEFLLKKHNGQFLPQGNISCNLCHSSEHPTHACFLRIPSCSELGIFAKDDKILYCFLTTEFQPYSPIEEVAGETRETTIARVRHTIDFRKHQFVQLVNAFFTRDASKISFRWERPSFSQMRNNLPHHVALGKELWIIIQIAFGVRYPWLKPPPAIAIGRRPLTIDKGLWDIQAKEIQGGYACISPDNFSECLHQIFGLESSDKLRGIHNLRYLNGFLPKFKYQQENLEDFIRDLEPGDLLWFEDMKGCFQQFTLCPRDRRRFGFQFIYNGRKYTVTPNYCLFGASLNPFFVKERFKQEIRILRMVCKAALLWLDDLNGILKGSLPPRTIQSIMIFCKWIWEGGGVIFGPKGVKWNPVPVIRTLGHNVFAPFQMKSIPSEKIEKLYEACVELLSSSETTLQELSTIAGRFLAYGPPIAKLFTSELFTIMSNELKGLAFREKLTEIKGNHQSKLDGIQPRTHNFLNLAKSPPLQWPSATDPSQLEYQQSVQTLLRQTDTSVTFAKIQHFKAEACDAKLYKIKIPVSPKLEQIFANWFSTLTATKFRTKPQSIAHWEKAYFANSDASEIGVGVNLLYQERNTPQATRIMLSQHYPFPDALKSFLSTQDLPIIRASCAREAYGIWYAMKTLVRLLRKFHREPLPIFIYTDNLAVAFMFHSQHAQNYITQKYLRETLQLLHSLNEPFEILWKRRSEPSAESADLASKLPPWECSPILKTRLRRILKMPRTTRFHYPVAPLDMLRLRRGRVPDSLLPWHQSTDMSRIIIIIVPPNLQKQTYANVVECFLQFSWNGFLIVPRLHFKQWFSSLVQTLGPPLKVDTTPENFHSSIFQTKVFNLQMAIFRLKS